MPETALPLTFNPEQRAQFFTHILLYLFLLIKQTNAPGNEQLLLTMRDLELRFWQFQACPGSQVSLTLSPEELQGTKLMFEVLQAEYERWLLADENPLPLEHLAACRLLIAQAEAEQHTAGKGQ